MSDKFLSDDYDDFLAQVKQRIRTTKIKAASRRVNCATACCTNHQRKIITLFLIL